MSLPTAVINKLGAQRLRRFHTWCYRNELVTPPDTNVPGSVVQVVDGQGNPIGQALYAQRSPIALRLLTRKSPDSEKVDDAFFLARLERALARRAPLKARDAYRLVHGEADRLPGLFVDRYAQGLTIQTLSEGMDARKEWIARELARLTGVTHVVCRDAASGRDFEGLTRETRLLHGQGAARFTYHEGVHAFEVDLLGDMKTGSFLDQVDNHVRAGELGWGEALDCFSYHGGFALALSARCSEVTAVEQDATAAARIRENAQRNGRTHVKVLEANAFDVLAHADKDGKKYDTIVIDPPGFAKRKEGLRSAERAYRELNVRALRCLRPEGVLITCSCSGKVTREDFEALVVGAAEDARKTVQLLERRGAGLDHPVMLGLPESEYLKAYFLRVV